MRKKCWITLPAVSILIVSNQKRGRKHKTKILVKTKHVLTIQNT
jgi:hypothetical protein